jgi:hypothetical protein
MDDVDGSVTPEFTGVHQPSEVIRGTEVPIAWFAYGLRVLDFSANPHAPKEVAWWVPDATDPRAQGRAQANDVTYDENGLIYLLDRIRGCHILERT